MVEHIFLLWRQRPYILSIQFFLEPLHLRFSGDGKAIATFSVATNESWKNKDGEVQERTEWTRCTVFGATAEKYVQPYIKKGSLVYIEGSLKTDKWQDKDGNERYSTGVIANNYGGVQILGGGDTSNQDRAGSMDQTPKTSEENTSQVTEDDLPF
jgi:single-strand DNA-binding protein